MADFYAILRDAIVASKADNATNRAALYARAREALDKHLNSPSSPLSAEAQKEKREALEEAVRRIDAESHDPQLAAKGPSSAVMSQPKPSETEEVKDKTQVETTDEAPSNGNGTTSAAGTKDANRIREGLAEGSLPD